MKLILSFADKINARRQVGWEDAYLDYTAMKASLMSIVDAQRTGRLVVAHHRNTLFLELLDDGIAQANAFLLEQVQKLEAGRESVERQASEAIGRFKDSPEDAFALFQPFVEWESHLNAIVDYRATNLALVRAVALKHDAWTDFLNARDILEALASQAFVATDLTPFSDTVQSVLSTVELNDTALAGHLSHMRTKWAVRIQAKIAARNLKETGPRSIPAFLWSQAVKRFPFIAAPGGWTGALLVVSLILLLIYEHIVIFVVRPNTLEGLLWVSYPVAAILAIANSANDAANSMGTSVGAKALTLQQALVSGAIVESTGAMTMGAFVAKAISKGVIEPEAYASQPVLFSAAMLAVLLGAGLTTLLATMYGFPISATHGIIAGLAAVGMVAKGPLSIGWLNLGMTCLGWVGSPLAGMLCTALVYFFVLKIVLLSSNPRKRAAVLQPVFATVAIGISSLFIVLKGPEELQVKPVWLAPIVAIAIGLGGAVLVKLGEWLHAKYVSHQEKKKDEAQTKEASDSSSSESDAGPSGISAIPPLPRVETETMPPRRRAGSILPVMVRGRLGTMDDVGHVVVVEGAEKSFMPLLVISALTVAFAHGGNDVGNAVGPLAAMQQAALSGRVVGTPDIPLPLLGLGAAGFFIGILALGARTIRTVGTKITQLTPSRSFSTQLGAAVAVLASSALGLPVSTSHCLVGSVVGIGLAQKAAGLSDAKIDPTMLKKILMGWVVTIPAAAVVALVVFVIVVSALGAW